MLLFVLALFAAFGVQRALSTLTTNETTTTISVSNDRLAVGLNKGSGIITALSLDGVDLLGSEGRLYLDCVCVPSGSYTVGSSGHTSSTLITGTDSTNTDFAGLVVSDVYSPTNQTFQQFWFLRDGETGLHAFSHLTYYNNSAPFLRNLQELRTLFRPESGIFQFLSINEHDWAPLPSAEAVANEVQVQDSTWWLGNTPDDPYFVEWAEYFTKYTFSDSYRDVKAQGMFTNGSSASGTSIGAWLVMNTKETYFGGPLHSDLLVDGITYNYISSNHHGDDTPNITHGFDRTFGPQFYYFNTADGPDQDALRADAEQFADPTWNAAFYDSIASIVPNLVPSSARGTFQAEILLPSGAANPIAILTVTGFTHQDNSQDTKAYQYWTNVTDAGLAEIPRVKAGNYRLTLYADGIFGEYIYDNIVIEPEKTTTLQVNWTEESAGKELWRLGTPDKTSGEFKRGRALDSNHSRLPEEYRIYWGNYNFTQDFPDGINFTVGESKEEEDWNYVHWSTYGPTFRDPTKHVVNNNWTIGFNVDSSDLPAENSSNATLTIQLAGFNSKSGNNDVPNGSLSNYTLSAFVNSNEPLDWTLEWWQSSSCAVRSAISCYNVANKFSFPASWLTTGRNEIVLQIPFNASVYLQYDALRLEV